MSSVNLWIVAFSLVLALHFLGGFCQWAVLTQSCMKCLCQASSECNVTAGCVGNSCGPFQMTKYYWADGGKPTVNFESRDAPEAWINCANDLTCATLAVQGYMQKFNQDCNDDDQIDCDDFAFIHTLGGYGCKGKTAENYAMRYEQCKQEAGGSL